MDEKKLLKLAEFGDAPELTQFETILDIQDELEELEDDIEEKIAESTNKICEDIYNIPKPIDYTETLNQINSKLDEEIVITLNIV